jgi:signal transduction histidine kinase
MSTVRRSQGRVRVSAAAGLARSDTAAAGIPEMQGARATKPFASIDLGGALAALLNPDNVLALLCLALGLSAFLPGIRLTLGSSSAGEAVSTATTLILMFSAILFFGRFSAHRRLRALLLSCATATIALSATCSQVLSANHIQVFGQSGGWVGLGGRLIGWLLIASSALTPDRTLTASNWREMLSAWWTQSTAKKRAGAPAGGERHCSSSRARIGSVHLLVTATCAILAVGLGAYVIASDPSSHIALTAPTAVLRVRVMIAVFSSVAALAFTRERRAEREQSMRLLALAAVIGAASSIAFCATPMLPVSSLSIASLLRLCAISVLALSVCLEWLTDERRARVSAIAEERQRMAADVHDLIMQDLSLALASARTLGDDPNASIVIEAGERALAGARGVLSGLTETHQTPIVEELEEGVRARCRRARLRFDGTGVPAHAQPDTPTRDALLHIGREAVTNAVKHSRCDAVEVTLAYQDEWHLTVRANGRGFDPDNERRRHHTPGSGFGLASMRRSAERLGGSLRVRSAVGQDTIVEALLP